MDNKHEAELNEAITRLSNAYKWHNIILRSLVSGLFTAIGATVFFSLILLIISRVQGLPIIEQFMEATGLDNVVEYVLEQSQQEQSFNQDSKPQD